MQRISLEVYTSALEAVKIITDVVDHKIELSIPAGSVLLDNVLNLKIILEQAKKVGKEVDFVTDDKFGKNLIDVLRGEKGEAPVGSTIAKSDYMRVSSRIKIPPMKIPTINFHLNTSKFKSLGLVIPVVFVGIIGLGYLFLSQQHKAVVTLYFSPQILTKSVGIKVGDGLKTSVDNKVLAGLKIVGTVDYTLATPSSGVELVGEKAKGEVTLYNSTLEIITVKKGTELTYKNKDVSYIFTTQSEATVPAREDSLPPDTTITKGTATVSVVAGGVGSAYNIKKDKELSVKGYKSSELTASSAEDFKGGSSKEVKVVTQADLTKLEQGLATYISKSSADALKNRVPAGYILIDKSEKVASNSIILNNKVGDKKDELSGSISSQVEGLAYSKGELADFMGKISQNVVPPGFDFHSYNKDLQVEVLGNTEKTVLLPTEADLQVTFKFYIAPSIDKDKIFEKISGLSAEGAISELDKISDIKRTELSIKPNLLFFKKVPTRKGSVVIEVKIEE